MFLICIRCLHILVNEIRVFFCKGSSREESNPSRLCVALRGSSHSGMCTVIHAVNRIVRRFWIQELVEDPDGCRSSFFLWSDGKDDVIHLGPVWDFDSAMGTHTPQYLGGNPAVDYSVNIEDFMGSSSVGWFKQLFGFYAFDCLAVEQYNSEIKPVYDSIPLIIDGYLTEELVSSAERNFEKWDKILGHSSVFGITGRKYASTYEDEVEFLGTWLQRRVGYLNARYASAPALNQHSHTDADGDGVCDICEEKLELSDMLTEILNALNPIRWIMLLITGIRDLLARLFLR